MAIRIRRGKESYVVSARKNRNILLVVGYNVLLTFVGLALIVLAGEVYLRLKSTRHFVQGVGTIFKPNKKTVRSTVDFSVSQYSNRLGFLDREPISPERAAASCHIAMIGDSFVEAQQVPIADKFHVRLEELAARHLPHLDITTQAYGRGGTGQINQLPYYDEFARHLSPELVVLVFVDNDFLNNSPILAALPWRIHPDRQPFVTAKRDANGTMKLRPPHPDWQMLKLPIFEYLSPRSYFVQGLYNKISILFPSQHNSLMAHVERLSPSLRLNYESLFDGWQPTTWQDVKHQLKKETLPPLWEKELAFTAFALDQFVERTDRDGAPLVILTIYRMGTRGHPVFDRLNALAEARGIPVIDQYDYIRRQGGDPERDPRWVHNAHWNEQGHQWAAEALLEYLKENPAVCAKPAARVPTADGGGGD